MVCPGGEWLAEAQIRHVPKHLRRYLTQRTHKSMKPKLLSRHMHRIRLVPASVIGFGI